MAVPLTACRPCIHLSRRDEGREFEAGKDTGGWVKEQRKIKMRRRGFEAGAVYHSSFFQDGSNHVGKVEHDRWMEIVRISWWCMEAEELIGRN